MLSPSRTNSGCGANRPVRPSLAVGAKVGKCDVQTVEPPAPEAAVAIEVHAASTVARSIIEKNLTARARKEANIKASLPKLSGRKVRKAPKAPKAPRAAAAAAAAAVTDRAVCQEVHSDQTWNAFRWIPTTVVRVTSEWADDRTRDTRPKASTQWNCGFAPCGATSITGFHCGECLLPRRGFVATYSCRGKSCTRAGRHLEFATVEDLLAHLESHEGFRHVVCPVPGCDDRMWERRLKAHIHESHPRPSRNRRPKSRTPDSDGFVHV
mmetsp:Transcript_6055/g.15443  ORF Transcript_6055/g.15443 Transcript_6055/m.15443 type:complete len:267 (-) Transcript_6055:410-1210(-)